MSPTLIHLIELFATLTAGIFGGSFAVAWLNRRKTAAEANKVTVEAESVEIKGHLETIDRILKFNQDLLQRVEKLEAMVEEGDRREQNLEARVGELASKIGQLENENASLRERCRKLEGENASLREAVSEA
jgi:predicted nuclease with TOPRIM domain